jgi:hypothetical protein
MENINNNNNFEQFLRHSIEDFKMIPARKVWHGIYNNMHPDRRWPSIAVCLLILTCIMYVGVANNNSINSNAARRNAEENLLASATSPSTQKNNVVQNIVSVTAQNVPKDLPNNYTTAAQKNHTAKKDISKFVSTQITISPATLTTNNTTGVTNVLVSDDKLILKTSNSIVNNITEKQSISLSEVAVVNKEINVVSIINDEKNIGPTNENSFTKNNSVIAAVENYDELKTISKNNIPALKDAILKTTANNYEEKSWTEDYAFRNKPRMNKLKEFGSMAYYITPSIGYRKLFPKDPTNKTSLTSTSSFTQSALRSTSDETAKDIIALNIEAGALYQYNLTDNIRIKAGLQANYTNYISKVTALSHPTQTLLAVSMLQNNTRSSLYSTKDGETNLNRTTWQIVMPVGLDIKITGNDKLKWFIGATAQPTFILSGNAFVLSSDAKYYISENSLLRKWNLNMAAETFLSYNASTGVTINIGPQFRYQILSSYKKTYNYSEKLYNLGVKVGLTTNF